MSEQGRRLDVDAADRAAIGLAGGGMLLLLTGSLLGSRVTRIAGFIALIGGAALFARRKVAQRSEKIDQAADHIKSELDDLDPVAQAQVIERLTRP